MQMPGSKQIYFSILFACIFYGCHLSHGKKSDLDQRGLKGKVKRVTEYFYDNEQAFKSKQQSGKQVTLFDIQGGILSKIRTDGTFITKTFFKNGSDEIADTTFINDTIAGVEKQKLGKNGEPIEQYVSTGDPKNPSAYSNFTFHTVFKYDADGNRVEADNYEGKKLTSKTTYRYNDKGEIAEEDMTASGPGTAETSKTIYAYDAAGNEIKQTWYDATGNFNYAISSAYSNFDQQGNWLLSVSTLSSDAKSVPKAGDGKTFIVREITYFQ